MISEIKFRPRSSAEPVPEPSIEKIVEECLRKLATHISYYIQTDDVLAIELLVYEIREKNFTSDLYGTKTLEERRKVLNILSEASGIERNKKGQLLKFWTAFAIAVKK